jgi:hypothetical protein
METKILTMEEIKRQYPDQWVLIAYTKLDENLEVVRGEVIATAPNREDIYRKLKGAMEKKIAIRFTGEPPADLAYLL